MLTAGALVVAWIFALVVTVLTVRRGRSVTGIGSSFEAFTASLPHYWVGVILLVVFAVKIPIFPVIGGDGLWGTVLPVLTLAIPLSGFLGQVTRDEFDKVLDQPFITTARARGMGDTAIRLRHALRHAVLPAITLSGWALGALISGAVIAENIYGRPGIGQVLVTAVNTRDVPTVAGIVLVVAAVYIVANLLVDLAYAARRPPAACVMSAVTLTPTRQRAGIRLAVRPATLVSGAFVALVLLAAVAPSLLAERDADPDRPHERRWRLRRGATRSAPTRPAATCSPG